MWSHRFWLYIHFCQINIKLKTHKHTHEYKYTHARAISPKVGRLFTPSLSTCMFLPKIHGYLHIYTHTHTYTYHFSRNKACDDIESGSVYVSAVNFVQNIPNFDSPAYGCGTACVACVYVCILLRIFCAEYHTPGESASFVEYVDVSVFGCMYMLYIESSWGFNFLMLKIHACMRIYVHTCKNDAQKPTHTPKTLHAWTYYMFCQRHRSSCYQAIQHLDWKQCVYVCVCVCVRARTRKHICMAAQNAHKHTERKNPTRHDRSYCQGIVILFLKSDTNTTSLPARRFTEQLLPCNIFIHVLQYFLSNMHHCDTTFVRDTMCGNSFSLSQQ